MTRRSALPPEVLATLRTDPATLPASHLHALTEVYDRFTAAGYPWDVIVQSVDKIFEEDVRGIRITPRPGYADRLARVLSQDPHFGRDGTAWREVGAGTPSLHILIDRKGETEIHVDSIGITEDRDPDGSPNYSFWDSLRHFFTDKLGWSRDETPFERYDDALREVREALLQADGERAEVLKQIEQRLTDLGPQVRNLAVQGSAALGLAAHTDIPATIDRLQEAIDDPLDDLLDLAGLDEPREFDTAPEDLDAEPYAEPYDELDDRDYSIDWDGPGD